MRCVMEFVLGAGTGDEVVESTHLGGHVGHLGIYYADRLFVDGFGGRLDGGVVLINGLGSMLAYLLLSKQGADVRTIQSFFIFPFSESRDFTTSSTRLFSFLAHASIPSS